VTPRLRDAIIAACVAVPSFLVAGQKWLEADAKAKEAQRAWDSYGEYATEELQAKEKAEQDEAAMERALDRCMARLVER
jgi:hypothetical protein